MIRPCQLVCLLFLLPLAAWAVDITATPPLDVKVERPTPTPATNAPATVDTTRAHNITVTLSSAAPGNLFRQDAAVELIAHISAPGKAQKVLATTMVTSPLGCQVYLGARSVEVPDSGQADLTIRSAELNHLPDGPYRVEIWVQSDTGIGYALTALNVWTGPAEKPVDCFGISYHGPLTTERTGKDLDLFRMAGVGWLRFPLHGWSPQGDAVPPEAAQYDTFVREATDRGFSLLAAFTPSLTVDPGVNAVQADKEYRESLLAAATRYSFKVKYWDLVQVRPDAKFHELTGVHAKQLVSPRAALQKYDKKLHAVFTVEDPFKWNAIELFSQHLPLPGDALGMSHNFIGLPEVQASPTPPIYSLEEINQAASSLKHSLESWVTEYGFDPEKGARLPAAIYQAALLSRALLLNKGQNITRTFWRHTPDSPFDLPLTSADGSAEPGLLAVRTTLQMLDGVTSMAEVQCPALASDISTKKIWAFLLKTEPDKKARKHGAHQHYVMAVWSENQLAGLAIKTSAVRSRVTDLWGNTVELQPIDGVMMFPVDEFPRFIDLGETSTVEAFTPFARFDPAMLLLTEGGENRIGMDVFNDQRLFRGKISLETRTSFWPSDMDVRSRRVDLDVQDRVKISDIVAIPTGARKGQLYEVRTDFLVGTRRLGYLICPIWYQPK